MPFDVFWDEQYAGKVGLLNEYRETLGMALLRNGGTDFNSTDPTELADAADSLIELIDLVNVEVGPGDYQRLAEGISHVRYSWSGNMNYAQWYLPEGRRDRRARLLLPAGGRLGGRQRHDRAQQGRREPGRWPTCS